ncbi:MAG: hypothetical protein WCG78_02255 [Candidatus Omnitrophota bacterium]
MNNKIKILTFLVSGALLSWANIGYSGSTSAVKATLRPLSSQEKPLHMPESIRTFCAIYDRDDTDAPVADIDFASLVVKPDGMPVARERPKLRTLLFTARHRGEKVTLGSVAELLHSLASPMPRLAADEVGAILYRRAQGDPLKPEEPIMLLPFYDGVGDPVTPEEMRRLFAGHGLEALRRRTLERFARTYCSMPMQHIKTLSLEELAHVCAWRLKGEKVLKKIGLAPFLQAKGRHRGLPLRVAVKKEKDGNRRVNLPAAITAVILADGSVEHYWGHLCYRRTAGQRLSRRPGLFSAEQFLRRHPELAGRVHVLRGSPRIEAHTALQFKGVGMPACSQYCDKEHFTIEAPEGELHLLFEDLGAGRSTGRRTDDLEAFRAVLDAEIGRMTEIYITRQRQSLEALVNRRVSAFAREQGERWRANLEYNYPVSLQIERVVTPGEGGLHYSYEINPRDVRLKDQQQRRVFPASDDPQRNLEEVMAAAELVVREIYRQWITAFLKEHVPSLERGENERLSLIQGDVTIGLLSPREEGVSIDDAGQQRKVNRYIFEVSRAAVAKPLLGMPAVLMDKEYQAYFFGNVGISGRRDALEALRHQQMMLAEGGLLNAVIIGEPVDLGFSALYERLDSGFMRAVISVRSRAGEQVRMDVLGAYAEVIDRESYVSYGPIMESLQSLQEIKKGHTPRNSYRDFARGVGVNLRASLRAGLSIKKDVRDEKDWDPVGCVTDLEELRHGMDTAQKEYLIARWLRMVWLVDHAERHDAWSGVFSNFFNDHNELWNVSIANLCAGDRDLCALITREAMTYSQLLYLRRNLIAIAWLERSMAPLADIHRHYLDDLLGRWDPAGDETLNAVIARAPIADDLCQRGLKGVVEKVPGAEHLDADRIAGQLAVSFERHLRMLARTSSNTRWPWPRWSGTAEFQGGSHFGDELVAAMAPLILAHWERARSVEAAPQAVQPGPMVDPGSYV